MAGQWDSINVEADRREYGGRGYYRLPIDLTPGAIEGRPACWRSYGTSGGFWHTWACTRPVGHTGRHAAGDGNRIRAVW